MNGSASPRREGIAAAGLAAAFMIAHQVSARATRDALFLSAFDVTALPMAVMGAAAISLAWVLLGGPLFVRWGPERVVPLGFGISAGLHLLEWGTASLSPPVTAIAVYLHVAVFGIFLISSFWSLITERFDPRTARRRMGRIAAGASLGGLLGGFASARLGTAVSLSSVLGFLAFLHVAAAAATWIFLRGGGRSAPAPSPEGALEPIRFGIPVLREKPYLRDLALLTLGGAIAATFLDYGFKAATVSAIPSGAQLLRFFAFYYTAVNVGAFVAQTLLAKVFLERLGLARTVASLPLSVFALGIPAAVAPGPVFATMVRGVEAVLRNSLYRSAYELHYTPVPRREKRAAKALIDVGSERLGDGLAGGIIQFALWSAPLAVPHLLPAAAVALALGLLVLVPRLARGYVKALEESLLRRAPDLELGDADSRASLFLTVSRLQIDPAHLAELRKNLQGPAGAVPPVSPGTGPLPVEETPMERRIRELRSRDPARIRPALTEPIGPDPHLVRAAVRLLAWDQVAEDAAKSLARGGAPLIPLLAEAFLDEHSEPAVRRRIPRVLAQIGGPVAAASLFRGLSDRRFELRLQSGRALGKLVASGDARPASIADIFAVVLREVEVDRKVWEGRRLLAAREDPRDSLFLDEVLKERADRSLEHVFTLLALALPREPLRVAFHGLHTTDRILRGTALEYLESVLPPEIRERLWPFLEEGGRAATSPRPREEILKSLLDSNESIQIQLAAIRKARPENQE